MISNCDSRTTLSGSLFLVGRGIVDWGFGFVLLAGTAVGGWIGAHLAVTRGDRWVRRVFAGVVVASAARLLFG